MAEHDDHPERGTVAHLDLLETVRRESAAFLDAALDGGMEVPVPSCPDWTMADLVGHLGVVQRFHGGHLRRGVTDPPAGPRPQPPETGLADWFREGVDLLLDHLAAVGLDTPAWNWSVRPEDAVTAFWHRRMAHEAAMHRWDAQRARGRAHGFEDGLAVDGVDEVLQMWVPSRRAEDAPQGTIAVELTDVGVRRTLVCGQGSAAQASLSGTASDVLLALWGRIPLSDLVVAGDMALAASVPTG